MKLLVAVFSFFTLVRSQVVNECSSIEDIKPCTCQMKEDKRLWIKCVDVTSADQLAKAVSNMKGLSFYSFTIKNSEIGILPSNIFSDVQITSLVIEKTNLTKLGEDRNRPPFLGLETSLQSLEINKCFQNENTPLAKLSLSHLKKLNSLHLDNNIVPVIGNNWFESGPYGLKTLYITDSEISVLGSHAFEALENVEYFVLSGNSLSEVTRDIFPMPATSLRSINLSANKLKTLPEDIFSKMPALTELFLHNNYFSTINEVVFASIWSQLEYAWFHGNPIVCDTDIKWIFKYRLPEHFGGYCRYPEKLRNKDFGNITLSDLEN